MTEIRDNCDLETTDEVKKITKRKLTEIIKEEFALQMGLIVQSTIHEEKAEAEKPYRMTYSDLKKIIREEVQNASEKVLLATPPGYPHTSGTKTGNS